MLFIGTSQDNCFELISEITKLPYKWNTVWLWNKTCIIIFNFINMTSPHYHKNCIMSGELKLNKIKIEWIIHPTNNNLRLQVKDAQVPGS